MTFPLEYHKIVKCSAQRSLPAPLALFGMLFLPLLVSTSPAQISATSATSSSHVSAATTTSFTSSGRSAPITAHSGVASSSTKPPRPTKVQPTNNRQPQPHAVSGSFYYPYLYAVPVPYSVEIGDNGASDDNDPDYQGGPTVFDRRGSGPYSYVPPGAESPADSSAASEEAQAEAGPTAYSSSDPDPLPDPTILVFKDGHQLEIANYAIVSQTLFDLTPGHPRKIALADLDLSATEKQNDDHGVTFQLPPSAQAN
jgi:hypothetical protein